MTTTQKGVNMTYESPRGADLDKRLLLARAQEDPVAWAQREREHTNDSEWDHIVAVLAAEASRAAQAKQLKLAVAAAERGIAAHDYTARQLEAVLNGTETVVVLTGPTKRLIGQAKTRIALLEGS